MVRATVPEAATTTEVEAVEDIVVEEEAQEDMDLAAEGLDPNGCPRQLTIESS